MEEKDYYSIKRVSSSSLSWFEKSPKFFRMMLDKEIEEENPFIFEKGTMVHSFILEPEEFEKNYVFLDYEIPKSSQQKEFCDHIARYKSGTKSEILLRAYKDCYTSKEKDEVLLEKAENLANTYKDYIKSIKLSTVKKVLSKSVEKKLYEIRSKLYEHKVTYNLLYNYVPTLEIYNEYPILWEYTNGVECKSMLDRVIVDPVNKKITIVDLKTSSSFNEFEQKFIDYKYYRQLAFYYWAIHNKFNVPYNGYKIDCFVVAINMKEPTEIKVFNVSEDTLKKGFKEIDTLMEQLKWHYNTNQWEYTKDYYEGSGTITI